MHHDGATTLPTLGAPEHSVETPHGAAEPTALAPCSHACPLGINVQRYVGLAKGGHLVPALEVIAEQCPMPAACGYMCQRPCEMACRRGESDRPVEIRWLKRAAMEGALGEGGLGRGRPLHVAGPHRVAIVGAGPAGLAAARELARLGHLVTLFERHGRAGGLLEQVVPDHRMPRRALRADVDALLSESDGIELRTGETVGPGGTTLEALREEGFGAVLLATGAPVEGEPRLPEVPPSGVERPLELLRKMAAGQGSPPGEKVAVLGTSNTAVSVARELRRLGRAEVTLVGDRPLSKWSADPEDVARARSEGVELRDSLTVVAVTSADGRVTGIEVAPTGVDVAGSAEALAGEAETFACDMVVPETDRSPDIGAALGEPRIFKTPMGAVQVDPITLETGLKGVFAAGECATGAKTVVEALAGGKRAARSIHRFLEGAPLSPEGPRRGEAVAELVVMAKVDASDQSDGLAAAEGDMSPLAATKAARRCLRCGPCAECDVCEPGCPHERFVLEDKGSAIVYRAPAGIDATGGGGLLAAAVDEGLCVGCGHCEVACPHHAAVVRFRSTGDALAVVDRPGCRGCGLCAAACPFGAIDLPPALHGAARLRQAIAEVVS